MGCALTAEEKDALERNRRIQEDIDAKEQKENNITKLLLLGAGESGKSTLFKQMIKLYGKGYDEQDRKGFIANVSKNLATCAEVLVNSENWDILQAAHPELQRPDQKHREFVHSLFPEDRNDYEHVKPKDVDSFRALWADPAVQAMLPYKNLIQFPTATSYWFEHCERMSDPNFLPEDDDILRARVRTTGISETAFCVNNVNFNMFDVGGQRSERLFLLQFYAETKYNFFIHTTGKNGCTASSMSMLYFSSLLCLLTMRYYSRTKP